MNWKVCTKCGKNLPATTEYFYKQKLGKYGLHAACKKCKNEYYQKNKDKLKEYYQNNKDKLKEQQKEYYQNNKDKLKEQQKEYHKKYYQENKDYHEEYYKKYGIFSTYNDKISYAEETREDKDGYLEVRCTYCGKWFNPTNLQVQNRIRSLNGKGSGEARLYCSDSCKQECPIYSKISYAGDDPRSSENNNYAREVQPQLRKLVLKRDNWTCIKCGKTESLHCHHIEGIRHNPLESADVDICVTLCKDCHIEVHKQKDCTYHDFKCNE